MRALLIPILVLFVMATAAIADSNVDIKVNGESFPSEVDIQAGGKLPVSLYVAPNTQITGFDVESDNKVYNEFFMEYVDGRFEMDPVPAPIQKETEVDIPGMVPAGDTNIDYSIQYIDSEGGEQSITGTMHVTVIDGSKTAAVLVKVMPAKTVIDVINLVNPPELERLNPDVTSDDLLEQDMMALGLTEESAGNATITLVSEKTQTVDQADTLRKIADMANVNIEGALKLLQGKKTPPTSIVTKTFNISNGDKSIIKSKVTVSVEGDDTYRGGELMLVIPKDIAENINEIHFSEKPEVIVADPVIKWAFKNVPQGQVKDYSYTVGKDIQNFETLAVAQADRPGFMSRLIAKIVNAIRG